MRFRTLGMKISVPRQPLIKADTVGIDTVATGRGKKGLHEQFWFVCPLNHYHSTSFPLRLVTGFGGSNAALLLEAAQMHLSPSSNNIIIHGSHSNGVANGHTNGHANGHSKGNGSSHAAEDAQQHLFVFSARSPVSLEAYVSSFPEYLQSTPSSAHHAKDLAFTLGQRRTHFPYRLAVTADSSNSLRQRLEATALSGPGHGQPATANDPTLAFIFTGQGAQYCQMARGLQRYSPFEQAIIAAEKILLQLGATWYLTDELDKAPHESSSSRIDEPEISQPACTAVQIALVTLLRSWDIRPHIVLGHSSGEVAAAFAAGMLSLDAAMAIAYFKGLAAGRVLADPTVHGAMLAVGASREHVDTLLPPGDEGYAIIAAYNSPASVTVSGDLSCIDLMQERAEEQGIFVRRLKMGVAYHSQHMKRVSASFLASIKPFCATGSKTAARRDGPELAPTFISTVTGRAESAETVDAQYWVENLIRPVQYQAAIETLLRDHQRAAEPSLLVEIGPHSALQSATKQILERVAGPSRSQVTSLPSLLRGKDATTNLLDLAGRLFVTGCSVNFDAINQNTHARVQVLHDLPPYEWNKATRYVHRPRVGTNKLFGGTSYNSLLGWKSPYSEGAEQAFRNIVTLDDLPWIRDHSVNGDILFPFTGFVSLAIEAFRSLATTSGRTVVLREFHVSASLRIEEDQAVDVTTKFRPAQTGTKTASSTTWAFEILSWAENHGWTHHARGLIEFDPSDEPFGHTNQSLAVQAALKTLGDPTLQHRSAQHEYELLHDSNGVTYGPAFRTAVDFWQGPDTAVHTMVVRQIEAHTLVARPDESLVTVDPPTLDTVLHSFGIFQTRNGPRPILVPSFCLQWRIANDIAVKAGQELSIVSRRLSYDDKSSTTEMDFVVFDRSGADPKPVAEIGPLKFQCISRPSDNVNDLGLPHTFFFQNVPYPDLMDQAVLAQTIEADVRNNDDAVEAEIAHRHDLDQAALHYMSSALAQEHDASGAAPHLAEFLAWAEGTVSKHAPPAPTVPDTRSFLDHVAASNATGELVCAVGRQLPAILRGHKQGLEVMLENDLLWRTYAENVAGIRANAALARYVGRLLRCHPDLSILELGAGTASATVPVLEAIERETKGVASQFTYTFTDISAGFFDKAKERLSQWSDRMMYSKLDISLDPLEQGFSAEAYDIVLASNVLHATPNIITTLKNVGCLLKPGGKLALMEVVREPPPSFIPYALLSGWWVFEDSYRSDGPGLPKDSWDAALQASGFSGLEGSVDDYPGRPEQLFSALWSSRNSNESRPKTADAVTVYHCSEEEACTKFGNVLSLRLSSQLGGQVTTKTLGQAEEISSEATSIVLDGQHRSIFSDMSPERYAKMKHVLLNSPSVLWVLPDKAHPDASMIKGLLRTLRLEIPTAKLVLVEAPLDRDGASAVAQLVQYMMRDPNAAIRLEQEYALVDNILQVPRLQVVEAVQEIFAMEAGVPITSEQDLWQKDRALEMTMDAVGSPDALYFRQSPSSPGPARLGEDDIIVAVEAAGINFIDLLVVLGSLPWSPPGLEGAGTVTHRGSRVTDLQVGDRVFYAVEKAAMATAVTMPSKCAHKLPAGLDAVAAASLPIAYSTALRSLVDVGRLQQGESVLVHSASGAAGQACVQLAQALGAHVFVTAGTPEKRAFLAQTYGIPETRVFSSRTAAFKSGILRATRGRGVDVVVNCLSGALLQHTWDVVADGGRFLEIGKKDLLDNSFLPMRPFVRNVSFCGIDLRRVIATKPAAVREYLATIARMVERGQITPIRPITSLPVSEATSGLRRLQTGQNIGKVVLTFGQEDRVRAERPSPLRTALTTPTLLSSSATYVIAGGTGGIGRALVLWMVSKGARSIVLLGRSALSNPRVHAILKNYEGTGIGVRAVPCDVGLRDDVVRAVEALRDLPPVKGVVHSAICLRVSGRFPFLYFLLFFLCMYICSDHYQQDSTFANLEYDDWQLTAKSRIQGAWNLHDLFPNLDFFVALSGMTGMVGNGGQSVYTGTSVSSNRLYQTCPR